MSKDCRIVVRMSEELRDWVHAQAQLGEQDDAAFVRMVLSNLRRGVGAPVQPQLRPPEMQYGPGGIAALSTSETPAVAQADDDHQTFDVQIDLDDLVGSALEQADAQGLTQAQPREPSIPASGVRAIMRPSVPYSQSAHPWISQ